MSKLYKVIDNVTVEDHNTFILINKGGTQVSITYGKEFDKLVEFLLYLSNSNAYGLPNEDDEIRTMGINV